MSIFISHTVDNFKKEPYDRFFSTWTSIWNNDENKNFLNGNYFNFLATRPSNIDSGFLKYAETYEKNTVKLSKS